MSNNIPITAVSSIFSCKLILLLDVENILIVPKRKVNIAVNNPRI